MVLPEHSAAVEGGQPVAVGIRVVVAGSSAMTFYEGNLAESFQTGARGRQGLRGALCTCTRLLGGRGQFAAGVGEKDRRRERQGDMGCHRVP